MKGLTLERLQQDISDFEVLKSTVYQRTYSEMINYFASVDEVKEKHLILFAQLIYGAMPTMVNIDLSEKKDVLGILNNAVKGSILSGEEILKIKNYINNSLVGTSKLLHFINPKEYAIWDSRIYRYITGKNSATGIGNIEKYQEYLKTIKSISLLDNYDQLHKTISANFDYDIQPSRVMEIIMFQTDKLEQVKKKSQKNRI